jgi:hypothetical protein
MPAGAAQPIFCLHFLLAFLNLILYQFTQFRPQMPVPAPRRQTAQHFATGGEKDSYLTTFQSPASGQSDQDQPEHQGPANSVD